MLHCSSAIRALIRILVWSFHNPLQFHYKSVNPLSYPGTIITPSISKFHYHTFITWRSWGSKARTCWLWCIHQAGWLPRSRCPRRWFRRGSSGHPCLAPAGGLRCLLGRSLGLHLRAPRIRRSLGWTRGDQRAKTCSCIGRYWRLGQIPAKETIVTLDRIFKLCNHWKLTLFGTIVFNLVYSKRGNCRWCHQ